MSHAGGGVSHTGAMYPPPASAFCFARPAGLFPANPFGSTPSSVNAAHLPRQPDSVIAGMGQALGLLERITQSRPFALRLLDDLPRVILRIVVDDDDFSRSWKIPVDCERSARSVSRSDSARL